MVWKRSKKHQLLSHLGKRNFLRKKISKLKLSNGEETEDPKEILEEEKYFYKNLYTSKNVDPENSGQQLVNATKWRTF